MISLELTFLLFCIFLVSLIVNRNIIFPSNILILSFLVAAICNTIIMNVLNSDITNETMWIIVIFVSLFLIFSWVSSIIVKSDLFNNYIPNKSYSKNKKIYHLDLKYWKIIFLLCIQLLALIIFAYEFHKYIGSFTSDNLSVYRGYSLSEKSPFPSWVSMLSNVSVMISYVSIYVFINNIFSKKKDKKRNFILFLSSVASLPLPIMSSSRFTDVSIILFSLVLYIHFEYYHNGKLGKSFFITSFILVLVFYAFQYLGTIIGRGQYNQLSFVYYYGGGISLFDNYIRNPFILNSNAPGYQTFANVYNFLKKIGVLDFSYNRSYPYGYVNGIGIGNVYSCLLSYFYDFGYEGVMIMSSIFGAIFGYMFEKVKSIKLSGIKVSVICYFYITYTLVFSPYSENIVWNLLSVGLYENLLLIFLIARFLDYKVQNRGE